MSDVELIMKDRDIDETKAREVLQNIRDEQQDIMGELLGNRAANVIGEESEA